MYFFQPDPYHEGAIGTASTHVNGYRTAQGANIIDCSTTAVGLGALRKDSEQLYMGSEASSGTFVIQTVEDSSKLAADGYASGSTQMVLIWTIAVYHILALMESSL